MIKLGQRLRELRLEKKLSLEDVSRGTKIRTSFLSAIERGEYDALPSSSYAQGFVSNYAQYLGFPKKEALALFRREFDASKTYNVLPDRFSDPANPSITRFKIQQRMLLLAFIFIFLFGFLGYSYKDAFFSPSLQVSVMKVPSTSPGEIAVSGKANAYAIVTINNTPIAIEQDGTFIKKITVFPGKSVVTVRAVNRFGRETIITKTIEVHE
jgi:transcriptional regulator with XRE-family HTH domain